MTDKVTCTGIWRDEYRVQLNAEAFYINRKGQGGVDAYHVRIDDAPAKEMVLATRTERDISAIMLKNIAELVRAKRLRVSGISILQSAIELYLDIADIAEAHAAIRGPKCK